MEQQQHEHLRALQPKPLPALPPRHQQVPARRPAHLLRHRVAHPQAHLLAHQLVHQKSHTHGCRPLLTNGISTTISRTVSPD